jgi:uncharacterized protein (DUF1697 family)
LKTFVAILRGINVSGQKSVKMQDLRQLFGRNGFQDIETYIQSGNVLFNHTITDRTKLSEIIEGIIFEKYAFHVPVIVRNVSEMERIVKNNPMLNKKEYDKTRLHVTFLNKHPEQKYVDLLPAHESSTDQYMLAGSEIYLYTPNGYGKTKLSNSFFEKKLKVIATTRNLTTVETLYMLMLNPPKN